MNGNGNKPERGDDEPQEIDEYAQEARRHAEEAVQQAKEAVQQAKKAKELASKTEIRHPPLEYGDKQNDNVYFADSHKDAEPEQEGPA